MQLTTRGRYGVMAMVELASRDGERPVGLAEIADSQRLSQCYLEQLFPGLRRAGLVESVRGPGGGYRLARPAGRVSIGDILAAVGETTRVTRCDGITHGCVPGEEAMNRPCRTHALWDALGRHLDIFLSRITLADVLAGELPDCVQTERASSGRVFA